jgi:hypothetical protein
MQNKKHVFFQDKKWEMPEIFKGFIKCVIVNAYN